MGPKRKQKITQSLSRDPSEPPSNRGKRVPESVEPDDDEQQAPARLTTEGVDKADENERSADQAKRRTS